MKIISIQLIAICSIWNSVYFFNFGHFPNRIPNRTSVLFLTRKRVPKLINLRLGGKIGKFETETLVNLRLGRN